VKLLGLVRTSAIFGAAGVQAGAEAAETAQHSTVRTCNQYFGRITSPKRPALVNMSAKTCCSSQLCVAAASVMHQEAGRCTEPATCSVH
jgi:hypothetical protein